MSEPRHCSGVGYHSAQPPGTGSLRGYSVSDTDGITPCANVGDRKAVKNKRFIEKLKRLILMLTSSIALSKLFV